MKPFFVIEQALDARPASAPEPKSSAAISLVVLSYNCEPWIQKTLSRITSLPSSPPVIVVDNASRDGTTEVIRRHFPQVKLISLPDNIGAAARNYGVRAAATPYVAFCDDDTWWHEGSLERAVQLFERHPQLAVAGAKILVGPQNQIDPICQEMAESPLPDSAGIGGHVLLSYMAGASAVRKEAFLQVGGYEPRFFIGGEEELTAIRLAMAGWEMRYFPELIVHHHRRGNGQGVDRLVRVYGIRNTLWTYWLHRSFKHAAKWTWHIMRTSQRKNLLLKGLRMALKGLPMILRERRPVPDFLERQLYQLDMQRYQMRTRDYG